LIPGLVGKETKMSSVAIRKWNYGHYSSDNYGSHSQAITIGGITLYFSYNTVVGFEAPEYGERICENVWTTTTGKHLNWLEPDKDRRIPYEQFKQELTKVIDKYNLTA